MLIEENGRYFKKKTMHQIEADQYNKKGVMFEFVFDFLWSKHTNKPS